ncbi:MAG TPA: UDP-N-acetylmuramoyl-L-alanine--D-glutamate ligase, partial [Blastocatellia bacterium]|nr:UDP-N-acetylmuramoyl-L-alanine--D-glutamate ligase [Blastocatellia bacterium]
MDVEGKKALVVGVARSGVAAAQLLVERGAVVIANDLKPESSLQAEAEQLRKLGVMVSFGAHPESLFMNADLV